MRSLQLILVQHGLARPPAEGAESELTAEGRSEVERMAAWAAASGITAERMRHSGKLRAAQTAALLAATLDPPAGIEAVSGMKPMDEVLPVANSLQDETGCLMLVGHMPHLSRLAGLMLAGNADSRPVAFRNAGLVCLERENEIWSLRWAVVPQLLP